MLTTDSVPSPMNERLAPAINLVSSILRRRGQISIDEIEAIPFVDNQADVEQILRTLMNSFDIEIRQEKVQSKPILRWRQIVRVKLPDRGTATLEK